MSELAKEARRAAREKANRLGGDGRDPSKRVDASSWTPPPPLNTYRKTGARPLRARIYKAGGAIQGDRAPRHAGKAPRGGYASGGKTLNEKFARETYASPYSELNEEQRANVEDQRQSRRIEKSGDWRKLGVKTRRASGGKVGGALSMTNVADENKREFGSFHEGGYKRGGKAGVGAKNGMKHFVDMELPGLRGREGKYDQNQNKGYASGGSVSEAARDVHKHESHMHKGEPKTKLASGGKANWIAGAIKHPGALHKSLGVPEGKKIPEAKLEKAEHSKNPKTAKRARLAETLKGLHKADGGRTERAHGGRAKGKTNINIVIAQPHGQAPQMPMQGPTRPPVLPPPTPPVPQMTPPAGAGPGMPPGAAPMMRKRGGRTGYPIDDGAGSGEGRLEKTRRAEQTYVRA